MAGRPRGELTEKHWKALKLFEAGKSAKEVAAAIEVSTNYLEYLCYGNIQKGGYVADLFKKEYQKINVNRDERLKSLKSLATEIALTNIISTLTKIKDKEVSEELSQEEKKMSGTLLNAISNLTPLVDVKSLSYSYIDGMTPEELIHEFTRLKSIAENSFNRRPVRKSPDGGSEELSEGDESGV